ncbi:MAG: bifunctional folylpolyglutamate synthase/dihydrofolate synthase [Oleiphilaceae bacterium]|nr:bifunctional folylpolyglutamate synthase/dihydrofolate synthase [Oleiphilaceae bacterium]
MTLNEWLSELEKRHSQEIDLGLDRIRTVFDALNIADKLPRIVTVAGTNGKGSTLQAIVEGLHSVGVRTASYISPHFHRFNERIVLGHSELDDESIVAAFEQVEKARHQVSLSYFEFTTLAAFVAFSKEFLAGRLDVAVLEVGLGGRLDAVNIVDADVAIVTSIGLDHQDWLGDTLEQIAREKAGVFRKHQASYIGETFPPSVRLELNNNDIYPAMYLREFGSWSVLSEGAVFDYKGSEVVLNCFAYNDLPHNNLALAMQACLKIFELSQQEFESNQLELCAQAISKTQVSGRLERVSENPEILFDVAHNGAAAKLLSSHLKQKYLGRKLIAVFSCLKDKDLREIVLALDGVITQWHIAELDGPRARPLEEMSSQMIGMSQEVSTFNNLKEAFEGAKSIAMSSGAVVVVFGSFFVIEALRAQVKS